MQPRQQHKQNAMTIIHRPLILILLLAWAKDGTCRGTYICRGIPARTNNTLGHASKHVECPLLQRDQFDRSLRSPLTGQLTRTNICHCDLFVRPLRSPLPGQLISANICHCDLFVRPLRSPLPGQLISIIYLMSSTMGSQLTLS